MIYIDTNILIYLLEQHDPFSYQVAEILEEMTKKGKSFVTSAITVTEFLAGTSSSSLETLQQVPNLAIIQLNENLAEQAAVLQKKHKMQIGDSIHLATAILQNTESFFSNDKKLSSIVEKYMAIIKL